MKILAVKQGSPEWTTARLGVVTASEVDAIVTPEFAPRKGDGVTSYLYEKLTERILGFPQTDPGSFAMDQGSIMEHEALPWYCFDRGIKVDKVGFCQSDDGQIGCSPDGLIGEDGGIEIKCPQPKQALKYLCEGGVPKQYLAQVHFCMFVTGRAWWDFLSYSRQFPALVVRVQRDEEIQRKIGVALEPFLARYRTLYAKLTAERDAENAAKTAAYLKENIAGQPRADSQ